MMQQFYQHLANGLRKAEALRQVQRQFIQGKLTANDTLQRSAPNSPAAPRLTRSNFSHPYYWAPFILIGNSL
jgi:CHAT domain-containing protein